MSLNIEPNPLRLLCRKLGGIHRVLDLLDILDSQASYFYVNDDSQSDRNYCAAKLGNFVPQYKLLDDDNLTKFSSGRLIWIKKESFKGPLIDTAQFLNELEDAINHRVYVPENIYFQTLDAIERLRNGANKKASV